ncbi:MAG: sigma-70 family RNA polymerase sigma factor [Gemmatimonadetes bacterium]|uniref:Sigma-70 family RNA polymerase sigma factor n=1 Tax=Candidatus Kutchimonas denitrificans TaxID=3056748 RepID=A0AAE4ZC18_9BACT|nr:sigma-70 family RNA polymerase sigma factor [Gemmatimonadota bacterium]NIR75626.1 sigma-70 family RNA polymerase sigma factor [Candidatus Kutchimonas denitrificans]NIS02927.1 sigma-70 family RNA polymerase sigma factor [Gemmatimonadota bacterium]NIT68649.1 sigma-70 family RNA polymerase sigma factor [Gemmatimonadota bacterium]NIV25328.1 sigma-70 family RNA polymerase sigma factor [Gemmatimonadota bacterium]
MEAERTATGDGRWSDADVVRAVLNGNPEAYGVLVRRYQDKLYRHAERMTGQGDVAAEIVQAALIKGYEKLDRCRDAGRVGAWLFRINANQCRDYLRDPRRDELRLEADPARESDEHPERDAEQRELRERLAEALERLSPEERQALTLKHVDGCSYPEMSELLGASVSALKMRVHRAREALRTLLEEYR